MAWNGKVYLVLWHELDMLYGARAEPDGTVLDPDGFPIDVFNSIDLHPAIASDGENFLVVQAGQNGDLVGVRIGGDGTVLDSNPITISSGASGLGIPQIGWGAGVYTVVWAEAPNQAIRGARMTPDGLLLDPGGFNISGGGADVDAFIDFDGQNFYVTWTRDVGGNDVLMASHVTPGGQVASGPMTLLSGSSFGIIALPHVAWNGTHHLITITTGEPLFSNSDLYALRVDVDGVPIEMPFPVSTIEGESAMPFGVATVDGQWFVQWEGSEIIGSSFHYDTEGSRVAADGDVLDQPHLEVATNAAWQLSSACAFDGTNFLCVFDDEREGPNNYHEKRKVTSMATVSSICWMSHRLCNCCLVNELHGFN